jgi:transposase InsO family protein
MRLVAVVQAAPSVREGCRRAGIHHSTYYDWVRRIEAAGPEGLTPRASRTRVTSPERIRLEADVVAYALAHPAWGPDRVHDELCRHGVAVGSVSQVWRILRSHGLNRAGYRYQLMALARGLVTADAALTVEEPTGPLHRSKRWIGQLKAEKPGDLVQLDCFQIGRLKEARLTTAKVPGVVWQYTAIDVASSFTWAELHTTARNPSGVHTTALAHRVAADLARWGWTWKTASTDRGNEFVDHRFQGALRDLGVEHRFISPGRPQSNGKVESVQGTILRECWHPAFVTYHQPSITGLRADLAEYLDDYNHHRPHHGRWNKGRPPSEIIIPNTGNYP